MSLPLSFQTKFFKMTRHHLAKCSNFYEYVDDEVQEILALSVPEENKKKCKEPNKDDKDDDLYAIPIYPDNENKDDNLNEGKYIQVSDDENKNWEIGKIKFKNNEDECFLSPEWNNDFDFTGQNVHPADDKRAKWSLSTLSESSLESPSFLGSDEYSLMHIKSVA
ncbi:1504_t:CDS:2 [Rhizophagus irregularis]|nr:1504_t:CDS:2 [Rhizophagus irregularis]